MAAGRACQLMIFGLTVASVLDDPVWSCAPRNLDVADLWSGVAAVSAAALLEPYTHALAFDIKDGINDMDGQIPAFRRKVERKLFALYKISRVHSQLHCTSVHICLSKEKT